MFKFNFPFLAALAVTLGAAPTVAIGPTQAQAASQDAGRFVEALAERAFAALQGDRAASRAQLRKVLAQNFAVDSLGDRLIRGWRQRISPSQYSAYKAAVPDFLIGTYADRLHEYAGADIRVVRVQNQGANAAVLTRVTKPGARPVNVVWTLTRAGGSYKVSNLTVGGVNVALSQAADFNSYAQRNGFDALINFMKRRG